MNVSAPECEEADLREGVNGQLAAFERTADAYPFKEAIGEGDSRLTYADLRELVERCAAGLLGAGMGPLAVWR